MHEVAIRQLDECYLYLDVDDQLYRVSWQQCSRKLRHATQQERAFIQISPSGYGLHWPLIDEDLAINPLLKLAEKMDRLPAPTAGLLVAV
ncbi:MAG: DUF2442 domain-containing protein [Caldilinea sp. CFX5]|nr:DUF2442 domain-containing protein [Caldilinea sp. CFX5]